jgi:uncharacterized RDD family membrane protein YckC
LIPLAVTDGALAAVPAAGPEPRELAPPQGALFPHRPQLKVIPFETLPGAVRAQGAAVAVPAPARTAPRRAPAAKAAGQPTLDFLPAAHQTSRTLRTRAAAVIYCEAPVATPAHRAVAAALDLALSLIAFAVFLGTFWLCGGEFVLSKATLPVYVGAYVLLAMFHHLLWVLASGDTPGMQWTQLRLVNFDGFPAERRERFTRYLGACLSFAAAGLGLMWALVDEESLTWQDHISKTFPTLREIDTSRVRNA